MQTAIFVDLDHTVFYTRENIINFPTPQGFKAVPTHYYGVWHSKPRPRAKQTLQMLHKNFDKVYAFTAGVGEFQKKVLTTLDFLVDFDDVFSTRDPVKFRKLIPRVEYPLLIDDADPFASHTLMKLKDIGVLPETYGNFSSQHKLNFMTNMLKTHLIRISPYCGADGDDVGLTEAANIAKQRIEGYKRSRGNLSK